MYLNLYVLRFLSGLRYGIKEKYLSQIRLPETYNYPCSLCARVTSKHAQRLTWLTPTISMLCFACLRWKTTGANHVKCKKLKMLKDNTYYLLKMNKRNELLQPKPHNYYSWKDGRGYQGESMNMMHATIICALIKTNGNDIATGANNNQKIYRS